MGVCVRYMCGAIEGRCVGGCGAFGMGEAMKQLLARGDWLVDRSGARVVASERSYFLIDKAESTRSNQPTSWVPNVSSATMMMMKTETL